MSSQYGPSVLLPLRAQLFRVMNFGGGGRRRPLNISLFHPGYTAGPYPPAHPMNAVILPNGKYYGGGSHNNEARRAG
jgi:hypothetical protein